MQDKYQKKNQKPKRDGAEVALSSLYIQKDGMTMRAGPQGAVTLEMDHTPLGVYLCSRREVKLHDAPSCSSEFP